MVDYFDVKGSKLSQFLYALFMNLVTVCVFETVISVIVYAIKNKIENNSAVYNILGYILLFQLIVFMYVMIILK